MTKPGGSFLFPHFIKSDGNRVDSNVDKVEKTFWCNELPKLGLENNTIKRYEKSRRSLPKTLQ